MTDERIPYLQMQNAELRRRLEIIERYVALSMSSSGATWSPEFGLALITDRQVNHMIMGSIPWDPKSLDQGG